MRGQDVGVLCLEHVGTARHWETDEKSFAASVADFVSLCPELAEHKRTADELRVHKSQIEDLVRKRTAELEMRNRELAAFSYSVSHDLRPPLRHIDSCVGIVLEDHANELSAEIIDWLQKSRHSVGKMRDMIDALLGLSRINQKQLQRNSIGVAALAAEVADEIMECERAVNLQIHDVPRLEADRDLVRIVLTNLFSNAWKYTGRVPEACIEFGCEEVDGTVAYYVRDNDVGFDPKHAENIFNVFSRLHSDSEFEGTGIGLATAQRIFCRHGGRVWAHGSPGGGATFYLRIPDCAERV